MPAIIERKKKTVARADALLARRSGEALARLMESGAGDSYQFRVSGPTQAGIEITLPNGVMQVLAQALAEMAKGHAVITLPAASDLTPQQAADLLGVSRPFLLQLLRSQHISCRYVGSHRRIRLQDILDYKTEQERRDQVLNELTAQAQELDMGY
jgi:excisionase family DNA binding protein